MPKKEIVLSKWQDYRGRSEGVLVYINTSMKTYLPVRDVLNEYKKGFQSDPNYETGTYNFLDCTGTSLVTSVYKNRRSHLLFGTSYQGTETALKNKFLIVGVMPIQKTIEARKRHVHKWMERQDQLPSPGCVELQECYGLYSAAMNFYDPADCLELSETLMKKWGYKGHVAKHMKLTFTSENLKTVLEHFAGKTPKNNEYIAAVDQLEAGKEAIVAEQAAAAAADEW